jgi:hypothetical protein
MFNRFMKDFVNAFEAKMPEYRRLIFFNLPPHKRSYKEHANDRNINQE